MSAGKTGARQLKEKNIRAGKPRKNMVNKLK